MGLAPSDLKMSKEKSMKYVKSCLIITMLLDVGYSQCNESNWQEYYPNMAGCNLYSAYLEGACLENANLSYANLCNLAGSGWSECEQPEGITDADGDGYGYDDVSYDAGAESCDLNHNGEVNVLDVVILIDNIINP